jgi:hypothetical protein
MSTKVVAQIEKAAVLQATLCAKGTVVKLKSNKTPRRAQSEDQLDENTTRASWP